MGAVLWSLHVVPGVAAQVAWAMKSPPASDGKIDAPVVSLGLDGGPHGPWFEAPMRTGRTTLDGYASAGS